MNQQAAKDKQAQFLKKIEDLLPKSSSLVNELADVLRISTDSAYRRMRGETFLVMDEILLLCNHYKISFDTLNHATEGAVSFRYARMEPTRESFLRYLMAMNRDLDVIAGAPQQKITYACEDIPVFHHFRHPVLAHFKTYYWMHAIMNIPELAGEKFVSDNFDDEIIRIGQQIMKKYVAVPSVEIWTETTIQGTIKQIEFFWDAGKFATQDDALKVCESLREEMEYIRLQAEKNSKQQLGEADPDLQEGSYQLYFSEIEITNNCVLVELGSVSSVYLGHFSFSTLATTSEAYSNETRNWLDVIIKKSVLISGVSEKQRYQVFKKYSSLIDALESKINQAH